MSNHLHLIISAKENNISNALRDFKKFTSKKILQAIKDHLGETRKEWIPKIFENAGRMNSRNSEYQFWQQDNQPKIIFAPDFSAQKLEYIYYNPVEPGIVER